MDSDSARADGAQREDLEFLIALTHTPIIDVFSVPCTTNSHSGQAPTSAKSKFIDDPEWDIAATQFGLTGDKRKWFVHYASLSASQLRVGHHFFVTANRDILASRNHGPLSEIWRKHRIRTIHEALGIAGAVMRLYDNTYYEVSATGTRSVTNYGLVNDLAVGALPNRLRFHRGWIKKKQRGDPDLIAAGPLEQSLHHRATDLYRARNHVIGLDFRNHDFATVDEILYHLRAAVGAAAAGLDSLAQLSALALKIPESELPPTSQIGFGHQSFRRVLAARGGANVATQARSACPTLAVLKHFRDPIIHSAGPTGSPLHHVDTTATSEARAGISAEQRQAIENLGAKSTEPVRWGLELWGEHASINPVVFVNRLVIKSVELIDLLLGALADDLSLPDLTDHPINRTKLRRLRLLSSLEPGSDFP